MLVHTRQSVPTPNNPGLWVLMSIPGRQHFKCEVTSFCSGIKHNLRDSIGRRLWEACAYCPKNFTPWVLSLCWLCIMSFCCKKSWPWVWLFAEFCESSSCTIEPGSILTLDNIVTFDFCFLLWAFRCNIEWPTHSCIQLKLTEHLLYNRHCAKMWE